MSNKWVLVLIPFLALSCTKAPEDPFHPNKLASELPKISVQAKSVSLEDTGSQNALIGSLGDILESQPQNYSARLMRVRLALRWQQADLALKDVNTLHSYYEASAESLSLKGQAHFQLGQMSDAKEAFKASVKLNRRHSTSLLHLGLLLAENSKFEAAKIYFRRVTEVEPGNEDAAVYLKLMNALLSKNLEKELAEIEGAHNVKKCCQILFKVGREKMAVSLLLRSLKTHRQDSELMSLAARGFILRGMPRNALKLLDQAILLTPDNSALHHDKAVAHNMLAKTDRTHYQRAAESFERAAALSAEPVRLQQSAARAYEKAGMLTKSLETISHIDVKTSGSADYYLQQGLMLSRQGLYQQAVLMFEEGLKKHPNHQKIMVNLMVNQFEVGRPEEAWGIHKRLASFKKVEPGVERIVKRYGKAVKR